MNRKNIIAVLSLLALVLGCSYSARQVREKLNTIKTAEDEKVVFEDIWENWRVHFSTHDEKLELLLPSEKNWSEKCVYLKFYHGDEVITYKVKNTGNIRLLLRE
jgi:hypothetical protein